MTPRRLNDGVRRSKNSPRVRKPTLWKDLVIGRKTQLDMLQAARYERVRKRSRTERGCVLAVTFTMTLELDQMIHNAAMERNVSRSAVVRQALLHYFAED